METETAVERPAGKRVGLSENIKLIEYSSSNVYLYSNDVQISEYGSVRGTMTSISSSILDLEPDTDEPYGFYNILGEKLEEPLVAPESWLPTGLKDEYVCITMDKDGFWCAWMTHDVNLADKSHLEIKNEPYIVLNNIFETKPDPLTSRFAKFIRVDGEWKRSI